MTPKERQLVLTANEACVLLYSNGHLAIGVQFSPVAVLCMVEEGTLAIPRGKRNGISIGMMVAANLGKP